MARNSGFETLSSLIHVRFCLAAGIDPDQSSLSCGWYSLAALRPQRPDAKMMTEAARLRQRAQWYRDFAKLGNLQEEAWRNEMADYFDRLAEQAEHDAEASPIKNH